MYHIMPFANSDSFTFCFQFEFLLFLFLVWLLWLGLPTVCRIKGARVGILDLFQILKQLSSVENDVSCGLIIYGLYYVEVCSLYTHFMESFIINRCWVWSKVFSASVEMIIWFLIFNLLMLCITFIDLQILSHPCIPGINPTWSWCMILLMCCWILFASILLRIFVSIFISDIGL